MLSFGPFLSRKKRTSERKEEPFFVKRQRMAKKTFSRGIPLENPPSSPTLRCVGEGLVGETPHPKASTTAFGWFCIGMREGEFCERFRPLVLSKGRINRQVERKKETIDKSKERNNRKVEGKNESPTSVGEDSILPLCEILKFPCPRRGRRPRRPANREDGFFALHLLSYFPYVKKKNKEVYYIIYNNI